VRDGTVLVGRIDGRFNLRLHVRALAWGCGIFGAMIVLGAIGLGLGTLSFAPGEVATALLGGGNPGASLVIVQWRLPRIVVAMAIGGALGMSGAIFQSLIRNPLGSPDVIGFSTGAHSGALIAIILFAAGPAAIALGAVAGGLVTAALVYGLAWRGGVEGMRLILVGVAISAMLGAFNHWLMISGSLEATMGAAVWGTGSLAGIGWPRAVPSGLLCLAGMLVCLTQATRLRLLEMGDDCAASLGIDPARSRLALLTLGTALTAAATAATGPIAFIALAAPQLAQKLLRSGAASPAAAGAVGGLLLLGADLLAQHGFAPVSLPVGLVTVCIGGLYLVWLLLRQQRIDIG